MVEPDRVAAASAIVRFIFTGDIPLKSNVQALKCLLVAEQLQVADCAAVCRQRLDPVPMEWDMAIMLVQHQHRQLHQQQRLAQHSRKATHKRTKIQPPSLTQLPSLTATPNLCGLLSRAQDYILQHFQDLQVVWSNPVTRQRLLQLPYDAFRAVLNHPQLKVTSENTVLLAAATWLAHHGNSRLTTVSPAAAAGEVSQSDAGVSTSCQPLDMAPQQWVRPQTEVAAVPTNQTHRDVAVEDSDMYYDASNGCSTRQVNTDQAACARMLSNVHSQSSDFAPQGMQQDAAAEQPAPKAPVDSQTAPTSVNMLEDLCTVIRFPLLSYTYLLHVLPRLPVFQDHPQLVAQLQLDALKYQAASPLRRQHMAVAAARAGRQGYHSPRPPSESTILDFCFLFNPQALVNDGGGNSPQLGWKMLRMWRPTHQQQGAAVPCLVSQDQWFMGYTWNLAVSKDGFVGVTWRVAVPGMGDANVQTAGAEVSATFSVSVEGLARGTAKSLSKAARMDSGSTVTAAGDLGKGLERSYQEAQFIPPNCMMGFSEFFGLTSQRSKSQALDKSWQQFTGANGLVTLRCIVSEVDG
eukprot:jgi/Chrzof1/611/Cz01g22110.t1